MKIDQPPEGDETMSKHMELLDAARRKPVRSVFQADAWGNVPPDNAASPDEDGDLLMLSWQEELRATDIPVRVQIMKGTDRETAVRLLVKLTARIVRDFDGLLESPWLEGEEPPF